MIVVDVFPNVIRGPPENIYVECQNAIITYTDINDIRNYRSWNDIQSQFNVETRDVWAFNCGSYNNYRLPDNTRVHFYVTDGPRRVINVDMQNIFSFIVYFELFDVLFPEIYYETVVFGNDLN